MSHCTKSAALVMGSSPRVRTYCCAVTISSPNAIRLKSAGRLYPKVTSESEHPKVGAHNHGGRFIREHPLRRTMAYEDRNPVWLAGGLEVESPRGKLIRWSQPEIALYDDDPMIRISYPDLVEDGGHYYLTETQKDLARVHQVDSSLLEGLWLQAERRTVPQSGLLLDVANNSNKSIPLPVLPNFVRRSSRLDHATEDLRAGLSVELWATPQPGAVLPFLCSPRPPLRPRSPCLGSHRLL